MRIIHLENLQLLLLVDTYSILIQSNSGDTRFNYKTGSLTDHQTVESLNTFDKILKELYQ